MCASLRRAESLSSNQLLELLFQPFGHSHELRPLSAASITAAAEAQRQDLTAGADDGKVYRKARPVISFTARWFAIAPVFVEIFGAPPRCEWNSLRDVDDDTGSRAPSC